jgi:hypothetical protein
LVRFLCLFQFSQRQERLRISEHIWFIAKNEYGKNDLIAAADCVGYEMTMSTFTSGKNGKDSFYNGMNDLPTTSELTPWMYSACGSLRGKVRHCSCDGVLPHIVVPISITKRPMGSDLYSGRAKIQKSD